MTQTAPDNALGRIAAGDAPVLETLLAMNLDAAERSGLDPETYHALAKAVFAEMVLAGYTVVGEFHYVHHRPGGRPYRDPNAMGLAVRQAADEAGIRLTLLDTCYLEGGLNGGGHVELHPGQRRFSDGTVGASFIDVLGDTGVELVAT